MAISTSAVQAETVLFVHQLGLADATLIAVNSHLAP